MNSICFNAPHWNTTCPYMFYHFLSTNRYGWKKWNPIWHAGLNNCCKSSVPQKFYSMFLPHIIHLFWASAMVLVRNGRMNQTAKPKKSRTIHLLSPLTHSHQRLCKRHGKLLVRMIVPASPALHRTFSHKSHKQMTLYSYSKSREIRLSLH